MRRLVLIAVLLLVIVLVVPAFIVSLAVQKERATVSVISEKISDDVESDEMVIPVFRTKLNKLEHISLEEYVVGVVASEMPASFELEALKAQALTARTFIVKQSLTPTDIRLPHDALVTDSIVHQVYQSEEELREKWGDTYEERIAMIRKAVAETSGEVLTFSGAPITATFFSTSNGYTENAEDYWENEIPYLKSVPSPWDRSSPQFANKQTFSVAEFERLLQVKLPNDGKTIGEILTKTEGQRVGSVRIGTKTFSGREVREKLQLHSSDFKWKREGDLITIETKGWGHGVGMSQYGANGMAKEGKSYVDIVRHYYQNVEISPLDLFTKNIVALK